MKRVLAALVFVAVVTAGTAAAHPINRRRGHPRPHPIPVEECVDIGFNEDGTPIIDCP